MVEIPQFIVDSFTTRLFSGNPAAVCLLTTWLDDELLRNIAAENNLSETAFVIAAEDPTPIRWFTPTREVDLCGHATLASAHVLLRELGGQRSSIRFSCRAHGELTVEGRDDGKISMRFPALRPVPVDDVTERGRIDAALGVEALSVHAADHFYLVELHDEAAVRAVRPDMTATAALDKSPIVTAPGEKADFVSRFFAPSYGIDEDPVTGSAHCVLTPFWAHRLDQTAFHALQLSRRGGELWCTLHDEHVHLAGSATLFSHGVIRIPG